MVLTVWMCWPKNTSQPAAHGHWRGSWPRKFWLRLRDFHWTTHNVWLQKTFNTWSSPKSSLQKSFKKPHEHQWWKGLHPYFLVVKKEIAQDSVLVEPSESKYLVSGWIISARFQGLERPLWPLYHHFLAYFLDTQYDPHRFLLKTPSLNFQMLNVWRVSSTFGDGDVICRQLWQQEILYRRAWLILGVISISILLVVIYCQAGARDSTESTKSFCNKSYVQLTFRIVLWGTSAADNLFHVTIFDVFKALVVRLTNLGSSTPNLIHKPWRASSLSLQHFIVLKPPTSHPEQPGRIGRISPTKTWCSKHTLEGCIST